jgi:accessory gene regulator protein AgrB
MAFVLFYLILRLLYPVAVVLSVSIGVGGCLFPNSSNVVLRIAPSFAFMKTAPVSASAAEDITCLRTLLMIKFAPFVSSLSFLVVLPT